MMYEYHAQILRIVDGDTIDVLVDLGFNITREIRLRLSGVDTHETYGVEHTSEEYKRGAEETEFVERWAGHAVAGFDGRWPFVIRTEKKGKYGRYLAEVERRSDGTVLNDEILDTFDDVDP